MRVILLAFHPERIDESEARLRALFSERALEIEVVMPSLELDDESFWGQEVMPDLEARLNRLGRPVRVLRVPPERFVEALFAEGAPALVVVSYSFWSERVAMAAQMLAVRRFPTLVLGWEA